MKYPCCLFAALFLCAGSLLAAPPRVELSTDTPALNEPFYLTVESDDAVPELAAYPKLDGAVWLRNQSMQSTSIINGAKRVSRSFAILPQRKGPLVIPELTVRCGQQNFNLKKIELSVVEKRLATGGNSGETVRYADAAKGFVRVAGDRRTFYAGEPISLDYVLCILNGADVRLRAYPVPDMKKVVFADYAKVNPDSPKFEPYVRGAGEVIDGKNYRTLVCRTVCRALMPESFRPGGVSEVALIVRDSRRADPFGDDGFFSSAFFGGTRTVPLTVEYTPGPELTVKALPDAPKDAYFTGLVGSYTLDFSLDKTTEKAGGLLNFSCRVPGSAAELELLRAPELKLPGFRVYPPEIRRENGDASVIHYALIPLQPGTLPLKLALSVFDPKTEAYRTFRFEKTLTVTAPESSAKIVVPPENAILPVPAAQDDASQTAFRQLKNDVSATVALPLFRNVGVMAVALAIAGPLLLLLVELFYRRREKIAANPAFLRRSRAAGQRRELMKKIRAAGDSATLLELGNGELVDFISAVKDLPPGASATELAAKTDDSEAAELLRALGEARFSGAPKLDAESLRSKLLRLLKKVGIAVLCSAAFAAQAASAPGNAAFEKGDNASAIAAFRAAIDAENPSPALFYNLGCAYAAASDDPNAFAALMQAHLLAPGDSRTLEELNAVRTRLLLPKLGEADTPGKLAIALRDRLRPDSWILAMAFCFFAACVILASRRRIGFAPASWGIILAALLFAVSAAALYSQMNGPYAPENAVVTVAQAELRTLPTDRSGEVEATLRGGTELKIMEPREKYTLVSGGGKEGWMENSAFTRLLPRGLF